MRRNGSGSRSTPVRSDRAERRLHRCTVRFLFGDPLAQAFYASIPSVDALPQFEWVELGVTEDGQPFRLPIDGSRLTGGGSGAGKAGVMHRTGLRSARPKWKVKDEDAYRSAAGCPSPRSRRRR